MRYISSSFLVLFFAAILMSAQTKINPNTQIDWSEWTGLNLETITSENIDGSFYVTGAPSSCTVSSVGYTTQADCAFYSAIATAISTGFSQKVILPCGISLTNVGWVMPDISMTFSTPAIEIEGCGAGDSAPTILRANTSITSVLSTTGIAYKSLTIKGVQFDGNGLTTGPVVNLSYLYSSKIGPIDVRGPNLSAAQRGWNTSIASITNSYEVSVDKIKVAAPKTASVDAVITVVVSGGVPALTKVSGGSGYQNGTTVPIILRGQAVSGGYPCMDPGSYNGIVVSGVITSITTVRAASNCSATLVAVAMDIPPQQFGLYLAGVTDSTINDEVTQGVGGYTYTGANITQCTIDGSGNATLTINTIVGSPIQNGLYMRPSGLSTCTALNNVAWPVASYTGSQVVLTTTAGAQALVSDAGVIAAFDYGAGTYVNNGTVVFNHSHPYYSIVGIKAGDGVFEDLECDSNLAWCMHLTGPVTINSALLYYNMGLTYSLNYSGDWLIDGSYNNATFISGKCVNYQNAGNYIQFNYGTGDLGVNPSALVSPNQINVSSTFPRCNGGTPSFFSIGADNTSLTQWGFQRDPSGRWANTGYSRSTATSSTSPQAPPIMFQGRYWNGTNEGPDEWELYPNISGGTNGQSQLQIRHYGSYSAYTGVYIGGIGTGGTNQTPASLVVTGEVRAAYTTDPITTVSGSLVDSYASFMDSGPLKRAVSGGFTTLLTTNYGGSVTNPDVQLDFTCTSPGTTHSCELQTPLISAAFVGTDSRGSLISVTGATNISNIQITTGTTTISANTCTSDTATTMTGLLATSAIVSPTPTTSTKSVTGWGAVGGLSFVYFAGANTFTWNVCNSTFAAITPGAAVTWNIGAR